MTRHMWPIAALLATSPALVAAPGLAAPGTASSVPSRPSATGTPSPAARPLASGRTMVVNTAPGAAGARAARVAVERAGGRVTAAWPQIGVTAAVVPDARITKAVAAVRRSSGVVSVGATGQLRPQPRPVARRAVAMSKAAEEIRIAAAAHATGLAVTGKGVTIGIADDGVFDEHSELAGRVDTATSGSCTQGGAFLPAKDEWRPRSVDDTHGTGVASVAAGAADRRGMRGVAPQARVSAVRVVSPNGDIYPEAAICAAMHAAAIHLPVMNHSYGLDNVMPTRHAFWDPKNADQAAAIDAVKKAFAWSRSHEVLNIAATGNSGDDIADKSHIPLPESNKGKGPLPDRLVALLAQVPGVLAVGESDVDGTVMPSSASGLGIVDLAAVGSGYRATVPGKLVWDAGTSFSSPAVAGAAALVKQARPSLGPDGIERALFAGARPRGCAGAGELISSQPCRARGNTTSFFGHGLLDASRAVARAKTSGK